MVKTQEWLDKEYPKEGTCQLETDKENFGKKRGEVEKLDISGQQLERKLKLEESDKIEEQNIEELDEETKISEEDIQQEQLIAQIEQHPKKE